jgi:hypothetical protein
MSSVSAGLGDFQTDQTLAYFEIATYTSECSKFFNMSLTSLGLDEFDSENYCNAYLLKQILKFDN